MQDPDLLLSLSFPLGSLGCSLSFPSGVAHGRGEEHDMGRLGLGVPEDVLAGARKAALVRPPPERESIPSGSPPGESARISLGIPRSVMDKCWLGLLPGESIL